MFSELGGLLAGRVELAVLSGMEFPELRQPLLRCGDKPVKVLQGFGIIREGDFVGNHLSRNQGCTKVLLRRIILGNGSALVFGVIELRCGADAQFLDTLEIPWRNGGTDQRL